MTKPTLAVQTEAGRMYVHPVTGERVYSVTTIIENGIPKDKIADWYATEAAKYAVENWHDLTLKAEAERLALISHAPIKRKEEAADKGDTVHTSAENYLKGEDDGNSPKHMKQLQDFFSVSGFEPVFQEVTIWNRTIGYAGTADLIARYGGDDHILIDYKTGNGIWPEHAIQVEALARGEVIVHPDGREEAMPRIPYVGVLHLRPRSWWFHFVLDMEAANRNWNTFIGAKRIADWKRLHPDMIWGKASRYNAETWPTFMKGDKIA